MKENYFETGSAEQKAMEFLQAVKPLRDKHRWNLKPGTTALLVLDMQKYFLEKDSHAYIPAAQAIIPKIKHVQQVFLERGLPVIQTRHIDTPDNAGQMNDWWRVLIIENNPLSELIPDLSDQRITVLKKSRYDAFYNTNLENILKEKGITQVVITGVMTHLCCETTARSAFMRGFDVFFGIDTTAAYNSRFHSATLLNLAHGFAVPLLEKEIRDAFMIASPPAAHLFEKRWGQKLFRKALRAISVLGTVFGSSKVLRGSRGRFFKRAPWQPKIIIIGGGPAGIAAAIQLKRYGFDPVLFEKNELGGLLKNANLVENYPGFPGGIPGPELVERLKAQVKAHDITIKYERVEGLEFPDIEKENKFILATGSSSYLADVVVIAGGTEAKKSELAESLSPSLRENIFYEVHPLTGEKGKRIVITGAGDAAFDYALNLSRHNEAVILNRTNRMKALPLLIDRVKKSEHIRYLDNAQVVKIEKGKEKKLAITYTREKDDKKMEADYWLCALGRQPQLDFLPEELREIKQELIDQGRLYFIGDVTNGNFRQAAIAVGNGIEAAMKIYEERVAPAPHDVTKQYSSQEKSLQKNKILAHNNTDNGVET